MQFWTMTVMVRKPPKDGTTRKPIRCRFTTEDGVKSPEVWSRLYDSGFAFLQKIDGQVKPMDGLIVYVTNGEL